MKFTAAVVVALAVVLSGCSLTRDSSSDLYKVVQYTQKK